MTGVLIVLVVFYAGMLLFFISGPSVDQVKNLRTIASIVAMLALVASTVLIFTSAGIFTLGPTDTPDGDAGPMVDMDEEEVLLEEYLGLAEEEEMEAAEESAETDEDDTEVGHA